MRLELDSPVRCADKPFGKLGDVVIDPRTRRLTHLVVKPRRAFRPARLVPIELAQANHDAIELRCTAAEADRLEPIETSAYVRWGEAALDDPDWDVGIETVLSPPYGENSLYVVNPLNLEPRVTIVYDRVPKGEVEIRRASPVVSSDGERVGHVEGFVIDGDDAVTHVVLERGHLFGRREVTIPIEAVTRVASDEVILGLTKNEVGSLPKVPVHR